MGFSLLSAAELVYFFTLRLYNDRKKSGQAVGEAGRKISWYPNWAVKLNRKLSYMANRNIP